MRKKSIGMSMLLLGIGMSHTVSAEISAHDSTSKSKEGTISLYFDNDIFAGTDANYTNGTRISWNSDSYTYSELSEFHKFLSKGTLLYDYLSNFSLEAPPIDSSSAQYQYGFALTQLMFTPESRASIPPPGQRPYAGVLGVGSSIHRVTDSTINSLEISVGMIGPSAHAETVQDFVHDLRGIEKFDGWDNQIPDEFLINFDFSHKKRYLHTFDNITFEAVSEKNLSLGTYLTEASYGWNFRLGYNLTNSFYDPRLTTTSNYIWWDEEKESAEWSAYITSGVKVSYVAHNVTLDGPVFKSFDTGVEKENLVGEIYAGFGLRYKNFTFSYIHTLRSAEFKSQDQRHDFGTLGISYTF